MKSKVARVVFVLGLGLCFGSITAQAILLGFDPISQNALVGDAVDVALVISGLGDFAAVSLSTFDVDVSFDSTILSLSSVAFGDPVLGDQLDLFGLGSMTAVAPSPGGVNLSELSFDLPGDLDTLQAGGFTLATLTFDTLAAGTSSLDISSMILGDAVGDPLMADVSTGAVQVTGVTVPEPSASFLLSIGLIGLLGYGWWQRKQVAKCSRYS